LGERDRRRRDSCRGNAAWVVGRHGQTLAGHSRGTAKRGRITQPGCGSRTRRLRPAAIGLRPPGAPAHRGTDPGALVTSAEGMRSMAPSSDSNQSLERLACTTSTAPTTSDQLRYNVRLHRLAGRVSEQTGPSLEPTSIRRAA
jgi:hypothetical protein